MLAAGYAGASVTDPDLVHWRPPLWSAQTALSPDRPVAAHIHDARNDRWASGGVARQSTRSSARRSPRSTLPLC
jgi:hypothetical protein